MKRLFVVFLVSLLLADVLCQTTVAGSNDLRTSLGMGYDDNIFREAANLNSGWFLPYSVLARADFLPSRIDRIRPRVFARGRKYSSVNRGGNDSRFGADVSYSRRLVGNNIKKVRVPSLDFLLKGEAVVRHTTYYSRSLGEEVAVPGDNGPVPLADRYDAKAYSGRSSLALHWPHGTRWKAAVALKRKDYLEDFADVSTVDPLDYDNRRLEFTLSQELGLRTRLDGGYTHSSTDYDAWRARDFDGNKVSVAYQKFRYKTWHGRIRYTLSNGTAIGLGLHSRRRTDPFQGYYDYKEWGLKTSLDLKLLQRMDLRIRYSYSHREYARARVGFNPLKALRDDLDRIFVVNLEYRVRTGQALLAHFVHDNLDEMNPLYTYDRSRSSIGYKLDF